MHHAGEKRQSPAEAGSYKWGPGQRGGLESLHKNLELLRHTGELFRGGCIDERAFFELL